MNQTVETPASSTSPFVFYGWIVVAVGFVTLGIAFGVWYSFSVFFLEIIKEFGWSRAASSGIFSVFIISQAFTGLLAGHLQDRFGPRIVIPSGSVVLAACLAATSQATALWHFYVAYGVFAGASMSLLGFASHSAFIPNWFERRRGLALGIAMSGIGFGMLFLIPLVEKMINAYGWRNSYLMLAILVLFIVGPLNILFSRRRPGDLGLMPDGDQAEGRGLDSRPRTVMKVVDSDWAARDWTLKRAVRTGRFWLLATAFFFAAFVYQGTLLHSISAMVDAGMERESAAYYLGILGIFGSGGKVIFGYLCDRMGREPVNTLSNLIAAGGIFCLMHLGTAPVFMALTFAVLFGLGYGAAAPLFPSVSADIFLGKSFGLIFAMICIGAGTGGAIGPFLSGWLRDVSGDYDLSFAIALVSLGLSCLFIWLAGPRKVRRLEVA
jgi:MFS family permease